MKGLKHWHFASLTSDISENFSLASLLSLTTHMYQPKPFFIENKIVLTETKQADDKQRLKLLGSLHDSE